MKGNANNLVLQNPHYFEEIGNKIFVLLQGAFCVHEFSYLSEITEE